MPPGAPHHSFLRPYRIRVDDFSTPRGTSFETPALHLLSHTHSDHVTGLNAKSFGSRVVCSVDAKHMLLHAEPAAARIAFDRGETTKKIRPYAHLKIDPVLTAGGKWERKHSRDLLRALPLNTPVLIELADGLAVTITLIDANHCPGAVMFLVEGPLGNFLHTGDMRAEPAFLASLARNPWLQRYIPPPVSFFDPATSVGETPLKTLDAIYLDTACLLSYSDLPSKEEACAGIVQLISHFSPSTRFFINSWTWGYEDVLKAIGRAFNSQIHVDRYKYVIYSGVSDPLLKSLVTRDPESTRFHACERGNRCDQVEHVADVVYVNPITMSRDQWELYFNATQKNLQRGEHVTNLICPLSRHSSLPELQAFVKLFRPKLVVPNFLNPDLGKLDWACMPRMFGDCMSEGGAEAIIADMRKENVDMAALTDSVVATDAVKGEVEIQNLVGDGAEELARQWADGSQTDSEGLDVSEAEHVRAEHIWTKLDRFLGRNGQQELSKRLETAASGRSQVSESDCDEAAEARGRAAENYFASTSALSTGKTLGHMKVLRSLVTSSPLQGTSRPHMSPLKFGSGSGRQFSPLEVSASSPIRYEISSLSVMSFSPPFCLSPEPAKEQAFHSLFDYLQFNAEPAFDTSTPPPSGKDIQDPRIVLLNANSTTSFSGPLSISSSTNPDAPDISRLPLASPSITPSPPRVPCTLLSNLVAVRTPVSPQIIVPQKTVTELGCPQLLDLKKALKRKSTAAGLPCPTAKRRESIQDIPVNVASTLSPPARDPARERHTKSFFRTPGPDNFSTGARAIPPASSSLVSSHAKYSQDPFPLNAPAISSGPPRSDAEKQRRQKAKQKQIEIRVKLVRALPPDKVTTACKIKVEMREKRLAERRKRQESKLIAAKNSAPEEVPSRLLPPRELPGVANGLQKQQTVVDDEVSVDWNKSREYEDDIKRQRSRGLRYPELPRLEKSFMRSQSP